MRRGAIGLLLLGAIAGACNALNGSGDFEIREDLDAALLDGSRIDGSDASADSPPIDPPATDGGVDACASMTASRVVDLGKKSAAAYRSTRAKTIDAVLDDWECATPLVLDGSHAAATRFDAGVAAELSTNVYAEWDDASLYVAFVATTLRAPEGASKTSPFDDDSVELYVGGEGALLGNYRPVDREYVVDHKNLVGVYASGAVVSSGGFSSHVVESTNGFVVEMQIAASVVGLTTFTAGTKLGFDLGTNRGDGATQLGQQFWSYTTPVSCACTATCCCGAPAPGADQPSCDSLRWTVLELR